MTGYGELYPPLADDRMPMLLVILDGLGDRAQSELGHRTPAEAARTPALDALAERGASGLHLPFGPGRAASSEVAHWSLLGYDGYPFVGRAVLEGLGHGLTVPFGVVHLYGSLRTSEVREGAVWITGRAAPDDAEDASELYRALAGFEHDGLAFEPIHTRWGEAVIRIHGDASAEVTDTDPFFEHLHPWLRPLAYADAAQKERADTTALALQRYLEWSRGLLTEHAVNDRRREQDLPALDTLTTKWGGQREQLPTFRKRIGVAGGAVTSSALYRGLALLVALDAVAVPSASDPGVDLAARFSAAADLVDRGMVFVHVHTKALDEAGHSKDPGEKLRVLEAIDPAFRALEEPPWQDAVVAVTGDHATPSSGGVLHTGDPTPLVLAGPTVRPDAVNSFGEAAAASGGLGRLAAADVLPLMLGHANRPRFLGARATPHDTLSLPDDPSPMPVTESPPGDPV